MGHHCFQRAHHVDQGVQVGASWVHDFEMSEPSDDSAVIEYVAPEHAVTYTASAPMFEHASSTPDVTFLAPVPMIKHMSFAPDNTYAAPARLAPAPVTENIAPARVAPSYSGFLNPQFSTSACQSGLSRTKCCWGVDTKHRGALCKNR